MKDRSEESWYHAALQALNILEQVLGSPIGFGVLDADLHYVHVSDQLARMNGLSVKEHVGQRAERLFPKLLELVGDHVRGVLHDGRPRLGLEFTGPSPTKLVTRGRWLANYYPVRSRFKIIGVGCVLLEVPRTDTRYSSPDVQLRSAASHADTQLFLPPVLLSQSAPLRMLERDSVALGPTASLLPASLARVAERVAGGLTDKEISIELGMPLSTVRTYVQRIYRRLGVTNRVALSLRWSRR